MKRTVSRRQLLATLGISATAGCASVNPFSEEGGIQLGSIVVSNEDSVERTVWMFLERDGQPKYTGSVVVEPDEIAEIDPKWSSEPATYQLYWVADGLEEVSYPTFDADTEIFPEWESPEVGECAIIFIQVVESPQFTRAYLTSIDYENLRGHARCGR